MSSRPYLFIRSLINQFFNVHDINIANITSENASLAQTTAVWLSSDLDFFFFPKKTKLIATLLISTGTKKVLILIPDILPEDF